ncbi:MAG: NTP transferase domain-containing protein [Micromonosporaceae bacterium]
MTRRCVSVLLTEPTWTPPGISSEEWSRALAEDAVDLLATLAEAEVALVASGPSGLALAEAVRWPSMPILEVEQERPSRALVAAAEQGFDQAAVLACDAPDLPAMLIGKLLQPLGRRTVAAAPATGGGLLGIAACLPPPEWLLAADPDLDSDIGHIRQAAPSQGVVAATPGWRRLRDPASFAGLDPHLEGWEATRALLGG